MKKMIARKPRRERRMRTVLRECEAFVVDEMRAFKRPPDGRSGLLLGRIREALK